MGAHKKKTPRKDRGDSTMIFRTGNTPEQPSGLFQSLETQTSSIKLGRVKEQLRACEPKNDESGINSYENFLDNLRGVGSFSIRDIEFIFVRTRKNFFVISGTAPETYCELQSLIGVDFTRKCILESSEGKTLFMCHLTPGELKTMLSVSAREKLQSGERSKDAENISSVVIGGVIDITKFRRALLFVEMVPPPTKFFDIHQFADSIEFVTPASDEAGIGHYLIIAGKSEELYRLYVGSEPAESENYISYCSFRYQNNTYTLCKEY